ncbi:hypothetical protein A2U01_0038248, partial [Trifolium medium]|nr:hypothetical protein [Trifolium medium]
HFLIEPKKFTYKRTDLSPGKVTDYDKLVAFVGTFPANLLEDNEGNPLLDGNGLDMTSAQARLRQARNAKKKTAELTATSSSAPLGIPSDRNSPATSVEIVHEKRPQEDDLGDTHTSRKTKMTISTADEAILADMGPEAIRGEIAN